MKAEFAVGECFLQRVREFAAEYLGQRFDRKREPGMSGDPTGVIGGKSAGGHYTVDVRVELQLLIPAVQHAEEADFSAEVSGIARDRQQCCRAGLEKQMENDLFVLQRQRPQFMRQCEDNMDVACRQQLALARLEPAKARVGLTLRAVSVSAGNGESPLRALWGVIRYGECNARADDQSGL